MARSCVSSSSKSSIQKPSQRLNAGKGRNLGTNAPKKTIQTRLFAGVPCLKRCPQCGMDYTSTISADASAHEQHHLNVTIGPLWPKSMAFSKLIVQKVSSEECIARVDDSSFKGAQDIVVKYLERVNAELNASDLELWAAGSKKMKSYIAYMYIQRQRVVSLVLAERMLSPSNIVVGISRMYTNPKLRRHKFTTQLLNACCTYTIYGTKLQKTQIGWSHPTNLGTKLIESWAGTNYTVYE